MTHPLLIVDDEPLNLELISELLADEPYKIVTANNGEEAWRILEAKGENFATVLLDKMMPDISGVEVLKRIKNTSRLAFLPVIMQTAVGAASSVQESLAEGAFYYLTKPFTREMLLAVVSAAVSHWDRHLYFRELATQHIEALHFLHHADFCLKTHKEAQWVTALLAQACPSPDRVATGLFELLVNAIEHGNLELDYAHKTALQKEEGQWEAEVEKRLADNTLGQRAVRIAFERTAEALTFTIEDQGHGFDWQQYVLGTQSDHLRSTHGRGILIAQKLSFDSVEFLARGNCVRAKINRMV